MADPDLTTEEAYWIRQCASLDAIADCLASINDTLIRLTMNSDNVMIEE